MVTQSEATRHCFPLAHGAHAGPPQSTSVSAPSLIPSVQVDMTDVQTFITQVLEQQSCVTMQGLPTTWHPGPPPWQTLPLQAPEQQLWFVWHAPPAGMQGAHMPLMQVPEQQVWPGMQITPAGTHCVLLHTPLRQEPTQHCASVAHIAPAAKQS
jgi:hypothetical protein